MIGLPTGIFLAFHKDLGLVGIWMGLSISLLYNCIIGIYLIVRTNWEEEVRKVMERIEREEALLRKAVDAGDGHL